ncbi:glycoside hydrolase family 15 protein [Lichenicoccus sp.]|uniref:glycoside hydrolase family 15 protein n=1 Tax=Lichenicoccus sp. TaxID=2781899 RepID=UPI003D12038A
MSAPIEDHGIIGDLSTAALVAGDGTIDFMCWPCFDSPSLFASLLDHDQGGSFALSPVLDSPRQLQTYLPDSNVLVTRWLSAEGSAEVCDLLASPACERGAPRLIRSVRVTRGRVRFGLRCRPCFDYGRADMAAEACSDGVRFSGGERQVRLSGSVPLALDGTAAVASFTLEVGGQADFVLDDGTEAALAGDAVNVAIAGAHAFWQGWARRSIYRGRWREAVGRSALVLKLLTSHRHGSVAAAATFGLPEAPGGDRNWDYRAAWIRDSSFTVYAFMRLGYVAEATAFTGWVAARLRDAGPDGRLRIMYALDGGEAAPEQELDLAGYGGARPVRIGNDAGGQMQLDIYGELLDSTYLSNKYGDAISHEGWQHVCCVVEHVCAHWREPDAGIWEMRGPPKAFLHSRLMCWVAVDRALRLAAKRSLPAPFGRWSETRGAINADIWANFRHPKTGIFVQYQGATSLDAAALMMPLVRFVSATDPVWLATLDAIGEQLTDDGLVYRYRSDDGLDGQEGAFTACSFWYVECLARAGRLDQAQLLFERVLRYANPLGLYAEELGPVGEHLGNFPQALTHLALISAAFYLDRQLSGAEHTTWRP